MLHEKYKYEYSTMACRTWPTHMDMAAPAATDPLREQAMAMAYAAITAGTHGSDGARLLAAERMEAAF